MKGRRKFWVRSIVSDQHTGIAPLNITTLKWDYPGLMGTLSVYHGTLAPGQTPHEIHMHPAEEIEVLLSGAMEVITPDQTVQIGPGSYHYMPPWYPHTIRSVGVEPATFVILKWLPSMPDGTIVTSKPAIFDAANLAPLALRPGIQSQSAGVPLTLANGSRLEVVAVAWPEPSGIPLHSHPYDTLAVLLSGRWADQCYDALSPAVAYFPLGVPHSLSPVSDGQSLALSFNFYPPPTVL